MDWPLLRRVSRSFYLTLRLLPPQVRESIALAYLVARLSDTLADGAQTEGEKQLLARRKEIEGWLEKSPDRHDIETVWSTIQQGQRFDQDRFSTNPTPLSAEELDNYTYLVAGCVGEFWTRLCQKKIPGFASRDLGEMIDLGISSKTARSIGHLPQSGPGGMIELLACWPGKRRVLIHINNTNPILDEDSPQRAALTRAGIEVAADGMRIRFGAR